MISISKTNRNADLIIDGDYSFRIKRRNRNGVVWYCSQEGCPAKGTTSLDYVSNLASWRVLVEHNHQNNGDENTRKVLIQQMKTLMSIGFVLPREAINLVMRGGLEDEVRALGNREAILRILRRHAESMLNPKPYMYSELGLSSLLSVTYLSTPFINTDPISMGR